jgi:tetratricopeptide (TPR) repeat protein
MARGALADCLESVTDLLLIQNWDGLRRTLHQALSVVKDRRDGLELQDAMLRVPLHVKATPDWRRMAARAAYRSGDLKACLELLEASEGEPFLMPFRAWVASEMERYEEALQLSEALLKRTEPEDADIALRVRCFALAQLSRPEWVTAYEQSLRLLTGRQRGLALLEFGAFRTLSGDDAAARSCYAEALGVLRDDKHFAAHLNYNMAVACLRLERLDDALRYADASIGAASHEDGARFAARSWSGLGAVQRARGEWPRALHSYDKAVLQATDSDDRMQAWRGQARTLRAVGRPDDALLSLYEAKEFRPDHAALYVDLAAAKLQLGDVQGASAALERVGDGIHTQDRGRKRLLEAELARRAGDEAAALKCLRGLERTRSWVREERFCFPALFALLADAPLRQERMRVRVVTDGALRVVINDCPLVVRIGHREASLLARLVVVGVPLTTERLLEDLDVPGRDARLRSQALNRAKGQLCDALGWKAAIHVVRGVYALDEAVDWSPQLPVSGRTDAFCDGLYDPWVLEWREANLEPTKN